jgi:hypothetical protein
VAASSSEGTGRKSAANREGSTAEGLPQSGRVDVPSLARLFADSTTSYKYFFFLAILDRLDGTTDGSLPEPGRPMPLAALAVDMVLAAWYPHGFCRLSLGSQDMLQHAVDAIHWGAVRGCWIHPGSREWQRLRDRCASQLDAQALVRYVPYRLIRPFYAAETRGLADHLVNERIAELADSTVYDRRSPYFFSADRQQIILEPNWLEYLTRNSAILRGWTRLKLAEYLQARNPSVPGIVAKLAPPLVRDSLASQSAWWKAALPLIGERARCIYSGSILVPATFSLDHYLPWSFVAHDRPWNLLPVPKSINSSKSDRLPAGCYLADLASLQHAGIAAMHTALGEARWLKAVEPFIVDLHLDKDGLLDPAKLRKAYEEIMTPLETIARRQGFEGGWEY